MEMSKVNRLGSTNTAVVEKSKSRERVTGIGKVPEGGPDHLVEARVGIRVSLGPGDDRLLSVAATSAVRGLADDSALMSLAAALPAERVLRRSTIQRADGCCSRHRGRATTVGASSVGRSTATTQRPRESRDQSGVGRYQHWKGSAASRTRTTQRGKRLSGSSTL